MIVTTTLKAVALCSALAPSALGRGPAIPFPRSLMRTDEQYKQELEKLIKIFEEKLAQVEQKRKLLEGRTDGDHTKEIARLRQSENLLKREIIMHRLAMSRVGRSEVQPRSYMPIVPSFPPPKPKVRD